MELTSAKLKVLSEIARDAGQVFFAAALVEPLVRGTLNFWTFVLGFTLSLASWAIGVLITK